MSGHSASIAGIFQVRTCVHLSHLCAVQYTTVPLLRLADITLPKTSKDLRILELKAFKPKYSFYNGKNLVLSMAIGKIQKGGRCYIKSPIDCGCAMIAF